MQEAQKGIPILENFLKPGLTTPCRSPSTTPILIKKPNSAEDRSVQDLKAINEVVHDLHSSVPKRHPMLTTMPGNMAGSQFGA